MAQQTVWDLMVMNLGVRQARRLAVFIECWAVSSWESPPTAEQLVDDWGFTAGEVAYWLDQYQIVFASESDPTWLAKVVATDHGYVGIRHLQLTALRRLTDGA
jgi:hypothetical protein